MCVCHDTAVGVIMRRCESRRATLTHRVCNLFLLATPLKPWRFKPASVTLCDTLVHGARNCSCRCHGARRHASPPAWHTRHYGCSQRHYQREQIDFDREIEAISNVRGQNCFRDVNFFGRKMGNYRFESGRERFSSRCRA